MTPPDGAPRPVAASVTVATSRPRELARFYARLLGLAVTTEEDGWAQIRPPGGGLTLSFEFDRHHARPVWPSEPGRQTATQHLDLQVRDLDAAVRRAVDCGAVLAGHQPQDDVRVLLDPDGHPFCLFL
ncbi:VOC family protein [Actinomadura sp. ATCC 31491]|uniref:VOC family protein n=1 Tax=Actinomadura luzonensis TaxID=2805427 RepID=A0ABT0FVW9_9ACTN|nr:VOC family protein [Actinomadura luzonensis]MCK2216486.1 VOC family protein [Actinomadura luzonensis]